MSVYSSLLKGTYHSLRGCDTRHMPSPDLDHLRQIATALPEVDERFSHGAPCFYVRKKALCYFHEPGFHEEGSRAALWCPASDGTPEALVATSPNRYFRPTPSASGIFSDWLGMYLDDGVVWPEVAEALEDGYRKIAPKKLVAQLTSTDSH